MMNMQLRQLAVLGALALGGCDGQQYVSPDTVLLTVSHDVTGSKVVEGCNYVPVLLGSQIQQQYVVEDGLQASVSITRSEIVVAFTGADVARFRVATKELEGGAVVVDDDPPAGYSVELKSGCVPDEL
jgi:hypothetical protein